MPPGHSQLKQNTGGRSRRGAGMGRFSGDRYRTPGPQVPAAQEAFRVVLGLSAGIQPELIGFGVIVIGRDVAGLALSSARWSC